MGVAVTLAAVLGGASLAMYLWGPFHGFYELACERYPALRALGPAPFAILVTVVLSTVFATAAMVGREVFGLARLFQQLRRRRASVPTRVRALAQATGLGERFIVVEHARPYAFCFGLVQPWVCMSKGLINVLDEPELRAVLAHERAHQRRRDPLRLMLYRAVTRACWFLPFRDVLYERVHLFRELRADAEALQTATRAEMASALFKLLATDSSPPLGAEGVAGFSVVEARIRRLSGLPVAAPPFRWTQGIARLAVSLGMVLTALSIVGGVNEAAIVGCLL